MFVHPSTLCAPTCDKTQGDIVVGGHKFVLLSREEGSIIISSKNLGSKVRSGRRALGGKFYTR